TLLSVCSAAKPKIAPYAFTTTEPVLGVAQVRGQAFVLVEIPGLIEGAHLGAGLGDQFLRHAERTRVLLHILDGTSQDPLSDFRLINEELRQFNAALGEKPQLVVVNKLDVTEVRERQVELARVLEATGRPVAFVSAATREGVDTLLARTAELLFAIPREAAPPGPPSPPVVRPRVRERGPLVERRGQEYVINSSRAERLARLANLKDHRIRLQLHRELDKMGIVRALEEAGVKAGDTVRLGKLELEWV
ncbi:MAG: Obg family GTPase CgtA, partial [Chloroflexota bacterium]|nr:Obg family GTPase CgtA [Chloroflexota bacterium]